MSKYVFDIEADGLLNTITHIWMVVFKKVDEDLFVVFTDDDDSHKPLSELPQWVADNVSMLIAHNGIRYDLPALNKVLGYSLPEDIKVIDTLIVSRMNDWPNKRLKGRHGLGAWGEFLGHKKIEFNDFSKYSNEMLTYCKQDCVVNEQIFKRVMYEAKSWSQKYPKYPKALRMEHNMAKYTALQVENGWFFDFDKCQSLIDKITSEMNHIEANVEPHLGEIVKLIDKEPKKPQYKRNGEYTATSARIIGEYLNIPVDPKDALEPNAPMKAGTLFQRKSVTPATMGQQGSVRKYLEHLGIKWTEWNWKNVDGDFVKTTPKLNDKDIRAIGHPHADLIADYYTLRSRRSILQGWMEQSGGDGRLRGDVMDLGTATSRHSHKIIANIPSGKAVYGKEIRELFTCPKDKVIISADGASYQIRLLAHYLKDKDYTDTVLNGDAHQRHADIAGVDRATAKPLFFAIIFGAGAGKCASIIKGSQAEGKKIREKLINGIPNFSRLIEKVQDVAKLNGWIPGIDGRKVYSEEPYKAINYLIQSTEAILMKATVVAINKSFEDNNIPYKQLLMYHDEVSYEIDPKYVSRCEHIIRHHFAEAPKQFGVDIMEAGDVKVGADYYEVH